MCNLVESLHVNLDPLVDVGCDLISGTFVTVLSVNLSGNR